MVTKTKKRKSTGSKRRFIGKPTGQIQERVQAVGPEHFGPSGCRSCMPLARSGQNDRGHLRELAR